MIIRFNSRLLTTIMVLAAASSLSGQDTIYVTFAPAIQSPILKAGVDTHLVNTFSDRDLIYGTTKLPGSYGQQMAFTNGLRLVDFKGSDCGSLQNATGNEPFLVSAVRSGDRVSISIQVTGNCCHHFLGDVSLTNDNTNLDLKYIPYGSFYCSCTCCFGLTYTFSITEDEFPSALKSMSINGRNLSTLQLR